MIHSKRLLGDLQEQVRLLEVDLARQLVEVPGATDVVRAEFDAELKARRTAAAWQPVTAPPRSPSFPRTGPTPTAAPSRPGSR